MRQKLEPAPIWYDGDCALGQVKYAYCGLVRVGSIQRTNRVFVTKITFPYRGKQRTYRTEADATQAFEKAVYRHIMAWKRLVLSRDFEVEHNTYRKNLVEI